MKSSELQGKKVLIWGAGREGLAAQQMLALQGITAATVVTGGADHSAAVAQLQAADVIVKSPGIAHTTPEYQQLSAAGARFTSLMDLWLSDFGQRTVAVTGTKGKSTTASLVNHIFNTVGVPAVIGGNLGVPLTTELGGAAPVVVAEVSSYQAAEVNASPRLGIFTSLYPEHLPWHGDFETYLRDKTRLFAFACDTVVTATAELRQQLTAALKQQPAVNSRVNATQPDTAPRIVLPSELGITVSTSGISWAEVGLLPAAQLQLRGIHNFTNAALALTVCALHPLLRKVPRQHLLAAVASFAPLAHRLERLPSSDGRTWIDDGLATAPEAVIAALKSTQHQGRTALLFGGAERGLDFSVLKDFLCTQDNPATQRLTVIALGPAGQRFAELLAAAATAVKVRVVANFEAAIAAAKQATGAGDTVLLSPGAPSFDEFRDYEERSAAFRNAAAASKSA